MGWNLVVVEEPPGEIRRQPWVVAQKLIPGRGNLVETAELARNRAQIRTTIRAVMTKHRLDALTYTAASHRT